jgi:hypothetical protein
MIEAMSQMIARVWGVKWKTLPIDYKINLRYNYSRTIRNRIRRKHGIIDAEW